MQGWEKYAVAVNLEFVSCTEHNAGLQEGKTCCFHVPKPCSRPLKTYVFTQVGSLETISVRKKEGGKKKHLRGIKGCTPF